MKRHARTESERATRWTHRRAQGFADRMRGGNGCAFWVWERKETSHQRRRRIHELNQRERWAATLALLADASLVTVYRLPRRRRRRPVWIVAPLAE